MVEIRLVKNVAFLSRKNRSIAEWYKRVSRYIMCTHYENQLRVYFLSPTGHMFSAITFSNEELEKVKKELKKNTKLIFAIHQHEEKILSPEEIAQLVKEHIKKFVTGAIKSSGVSPDATFQWIIDVVENNENLNFKYDVKNGKIILRKDICKRPYINYFGKLISYLYIIPQSFHEFYPKLSFCIAYLFTISDLSPLERDEFNKIVTSQVGCDQMKIPLSKKTFALIYLINKYDSSRLNENIILKAFRELSKTDNLYIILAKMYEHKFFETNATEDLVKACLFSFFSGSENCELKKKYCKTDSLCSIIEDVFNKNISKLFMFLKANYKLENGLRKLIEDITNLIKERGINITIDSLKISSDEKKIDLKLVISNDLDISLYNVTIEIQSWVPRKIISITNKKCSLDFIDKKTSTYCILEGNFSELPREIILKKVYLVAYDSEGNAITLVKRNLKAKIYSE
ncbi:MAG: hypothetical protein ACP6IS_00395 [Candidatus Asgardarchaeia archaeon]